MTCLLAGTTIKKKVEDVMPIATGHEREELEAELEVTLFFPFLPILEFLVYTLLFG